MAERLRANRPSVAHSLKVFEAAPAFNEKWGVVAAKGWLSENLLGHGQFARAWELPKGLVVKLTEDAEDAMASLAAMRSKKLPTAILNVHDVVVSHRVVAPAPLYLIVSEEVVPIDNLTGGLRDEMRDVIQAFDWEEEARLALPSPTQKADQKRWRKMAAEHREQLGTWGKRWLKQLEAGSRWMERYAKRELTDVHEGNIGLRVRGDDLDLVILDMGIGEYGGKGPRVPEAT